MADLHGIGLAVVGAIGDLLRPSYMKRFVSPEVCGAVVRAHDRIEAASARTVLP